MNQKEFNDFVLVGGTALALQIGHRISVDIDLFGKCEIEESEFVEILENYGHVNILKKSKNILICSIDAIKIDFVNYRYPLIKDFTTIDSIRLASKEDIAAMKLNAIAGRGSKKDFIDLYYLLKIFTLEQMIEFYLQKFPDGSEFMVRKSLSYFEDADNETSPIIFENISWEEIKKSILKAI
jgi:predicted nucleotidyltransferase component of viral defense system